MGIIQASIPIFFVLIALELTWSRLRAPEAVRLNDALADLSLGTLSQLAGVFTKFFTIGIYIWVVERFAPQLHLTAIPSWPERMPFTGAAGFPGFAVDLPALTSWVVVFVLVDLCYYWSHRYAHEMNILWAGHVVHHSSEEYNLPVALRQSALHGLMSWIFYIPLALIGVPWRMFVACNAINLVYQFWIHTRAVGRLGRVAEAVLNTPSHHRVHHGVNPKYQDRNYAGVFIVWDKLFGTFTREEEEPVYGITKPLRSWNPLWANVHVFVQIAGDVWKARRWRDKLRIVFGRPGWKPAELGASEVPGEVSAETFVKFDPPVPTGLAWYGFAQFAVALGEGFVLLTRAESLPWSVSVPAAVYVAVAMAGVGGVFERARWAATLEIARHLTLVVVAAGLGGVGALAPLLAGVAIGFSLLSVVVVLRYRGSLTATELAPLM